MSARSKKAKAPASASSTPILKHQELRGFFDGAGQFPNFSFAKYYWTGEGQRGWVASRIEKKLEPGSGLDGQPSRLKAAKWELLVSAFAPEDYSDLGLCLYSYDRSFSAAEVNAYVQLTFRFPNAMNLHHAWEMVRAFIRSEIVDSEERSLPVLLVLHKPQAAGSDNDPHIHAIVLLRQVNQRGWGAYDKALATDRGQLDIHAAWLSFKKEWALKWPIGLIEMPV